MSSDEFSSLQLRDYQQDILERSLLSNTIVYLPTGTGKTLIATHLLSFRIQALLRRHSHACGNSGYDENKGTDHDDLLKLVIFVAPTKVLLKQQLEYFTANSFVKNLKVEEFSGSTNQEGKSMCRWENAEWEKHLTNCNLAGMTPAILCMLLEHNLLPLSRIDSIIFDECHHILGKNDPMGKIVDALSRLSYIGADPIPGIHQPLILGMTASLLSRKKGKKEQCHYSLVFI